MGEICRIAREFRRDCGKITTSNVVDYIKNYRRWIYAEYYRDPEQDKNLCSLSPLVKGMIDRNEAFSYQVEGDTVIAVGAWVKPERKLHLLVHEVGHVLLGHDLYTLTDRAEKEADRFTALVMGVYRRRTKRAGLAVVCAAALLAIGLALGGNPAAPASTPTNSHASIPTTAPAVAPQVSPMSDGQAYGAADVQVVITASGDKYHLPDCQYVKDRANVTAVTVSEALRLGKEPCKVCQPPEVAE